MFLNSECSSYQNLDVLLHIGKSSEIAKGIINLQKNSFVSKDVLKKFGGQKYADISRPPCWALYCKTDAHNDLLCKKWRNLFLLFRCCSSCMGKCSLLINGYLMMYYSTYFFTYICFLTEKPNYYHFVYLVMKELKLLRYQINKVIKKHSLFRKICRYTSTRPKKIFNWNFQKLKEFADAHFHFLDVFSAFYHMQSADVLFVFWKDCWGPWDNFATNKSNSSKLPFWKFSRKPGRRLIIKRSMLLWNIFV